jgi:hypothetical protein
MMQPKMQDMSQDGQSVLGARMPPSCLSICCHTSCAISGYEQGDPTDGSMQGMALIVGCLNCLLWPLGSLIGLIAWKPDPSQIRGDGTQRTVNNKCCAVICMGGPCTIAYWQSGDMCTNCCAGDAGTACILEIIGSAIGIPHLGDAYACCCWTPNPMMFMRGEMMHGKRPRQPADNVKGGQPMMQQAMMMQQPMMMAAPAVVAAPTVVTTPMIAPVVNQVYATTAGMGNQTMMVQQQPMMVQQQPMMAQQVVYQ